MPAPIGGGVAVGPSLIAQEHGGALLSGGKPGNPGHNQHTVRERAQELRGQLIGQLEGAAKDLAALLETARESDGDRLRCKNCGSFIPGVSKLKLGDILAVIRELRAILPAQYEHANFAPAARLSPQRQPAPPHGSCPRRTRNRPPHPRPLALRHELSRYRGQAER